MAARPRRQVPRPPQVRPRHRTGPRRVSWGPRAGDGNPWGPALLSTEDQWQPGSGQSLPEAPQSCTYTLFLMPHSVPSLGEPPFLDQVTEQGGGRWPASRPAGWPERRPSDWRGSPSWHRRSERIWTFCADPLGPALRGPGPSRVPCGWSGNSSSPRPPAHSGCHRQRGRSRQDAGSREQSGACGVHWGPAHPKRGVLRQLHFCGL